MSYTGLMADFERIKEDVRAIHLIATLISDSEDGADDVDKLATPSVSPQSIMVSDSDDQLLYGRKSDIKLKTKQP